jgi:hypothetical protein
VPVHARRERLTFPDPSLLIADPDDRAGVVAVGHGVGQPLQHDGPRPLLKTVPSACASNARQWPPADVMPPSCHR